jgi:restriction system protein
MPIPTYDQLLKPLLELAASEEITRRSATEAMIQQFKLSPAETEQRLPSGGSTYIRNRTGWAMSFLTKGGLIAKVAPKTYRAAESGHQNGVGFAAANATREQHFPCGTREKLVLLFSRLPQDGPSLF